MLANVRAMAYSLGILLCMSTYSARADLTIDLVIADVVKEARAWWSDVLARNEVQHGKGTKESARRLALDYARISALMQIAADEINRAFITERQPSPFDSSNRLGEVSGEITSTVTSIKGNLKDVDLDWGIENLRLYKNISANVTTRGLVARELRGLVVSLRNGMPITLNKEQAMQLAGQLLRLSRDAERLSIEINNTLQRSN